MNIKILNQKILNLAIQGKLVEQDPSDIPAQALLDDIKKEKEKLILERKLKKDKVDSVIYKEENHYYEKIGDKIKNIDDEIPFEIPENWSFIRLFQICWLSKPQITSGESLPYLDVKTLRNKANKQIIKKGRIVDIGTKIILVDGENSGELFDVPYRAYMGSTLNVLECIKYVDIKYLDYLFLYYKTILKQNKTGTAIPHINKGFLNSIIFALPPLEEQKRIVSAIEYLLKQTESIQSNKEELKSIISTTKSKILNLAIQGKLVEQDPSDIPAQALLDDIKKEKEKLILERKLKKDKADSVIYKEENHYYEKIGDKIKNIDDEIPFEIPENWSWCRLNNLAIYKKGPFGSSLTKSMFIPKSKNSIKVYEQKNAIQKNCLLGDYYISIDKFNEMKSFEVFPYEIIVSCAGTIGETYILPSNAPKGIINQALMKIKLYNQEIANFYLLYFDYVLKKESINKGKGTAIKNIPPFDILKQFLIPLPPLEEQKRIVHKIDEIFSQLSSIDTTLASL